MPQLSEHSLFHAPGDWTRGWGVLRRGHKQKVAELHEELQRAETFHNERAIETTTDQLINEEHFTPGLQAVAGTFIPAGGTIAGGVTGIYEGAFADITIHEKITHFPLPIALAILVGSGLTGAVLGLLGALSLTPQARAGKQERLRRKHPV